MQDPSNDPTTEELLTAYDEHIDLRIEDEWYENQEAGVV